MSAIKREVLELLKQGKINAIELFTGHSQERVLDRHGNNVRITNDSHASSNAFKVLRGMSREDWAFFGCGFFAFFADMLDFYSLAIQTTKIALYWQTDKATIASAITYTMLLRWVGAVIFGLMGDFMGRKYPMIINCILMGLFQVATIYSTSIGSFLATRAVFGIMMGGLWGLAASTAMEQCDVEARGILSGIFECGASAGFVAAAGINLAVGDEPSSWTISFWIGALASLLAAIYRLYLPESIHFRKGAASASSLSSSSVKATRQTSVFVRQLTTMFREEWRMVIYTIVLASLMSFIAHSSADSYTTFLLDSKLMTNDQASKGSMIMKAGGNFGAPVIGWISQTLGRRRAIVICGVMICILIPFWIVPDSPKILFTGGFFFIFFVQGLTGTLPAHLNELASPKFRALIAGFSFQIGVAISAPSAQIVHAIAERHYITNKAGKQVEAYGPVMAAFSAISAILVIIWAAIGPERRNSHFELVAPAGYDDTSEEINATLYSLGDFDEVDEEYDEDQGVANGIDGATSSNDTQRHELRPLLPS